MPLLLTKEIVWDDGKRRRERKKELETERAREKFVCEMIDPWQKGEKGGGGLWEWCVVCVAVVVRDVHR